MRFKIDPFQLEKNLTLLEFQFFVQTLQFRIEKESKENNQGRNDRLRKSLVAIRDILNHLELGD